MGAGTEKGYHQNCIKRNIKDFCLGKKEKIPSRWLGMKEEPGNW